MAAKKTGRWDLICDPHTRWMSGRPGEGSRENGCSALTGPLAGPKAGPQSDSTSRAGPVNPAGAPLDWTGSSRDTGKFCRAGRCREQEPGLLLQDRCHTGDVKHAIPPVLARTRCPPSAFNWGGGQGITAFPQSIEELEVMWSWVKFMFGVLYILAGCTT